MNWIVYPIISALMWGCSYTILSPLTKILHVYTINAFHGVITFIVNMSIMIYYGLFDYIKISNNKNILIILASYSILSIAASTAFMKGYSLKDINHGAYTMIATTYPFVTMILSYVLFNKRFDITYATLGFLFSIIGCYFVILSKK